MTLSKDTSCEIKLNLFFQRGNWTHVGGSEGTSLVMIEDPSIGNEAGSSSREGSSDSDQSIPEMLKSGSEGLAGGSNKNSVPSKGVGRDRRDGDERVAILLSGEMDGSGEKG
jgi:hypothetical protein